MIVTRTWLHEWVDLDGISTEEICQKLNAIGLEVDALTRVRIPEKIVVGYVKECVKHPDADKLSVCQVDLGGSVRQIVCGAKNVAAGQYVPVATVGAEMPNGMKIRHAKLRGVESEGMICSAEEIGLPKLGEGILVLDESVTSLEAGTPLCEAPLLNDDIIEIELTANRGDCLSIYGVARELSTAFGRTVRAFEEVPEESRHLGIGRILKLTPQGTPAVDLHYHALKCTEWRVPLRLRLRLAWVEESVPQKRVDLFLAYATHTTGVILRAYGFKALAKGKDQAVLTLKELDGGIGELVCDDRRVALVGICQDDDFRPSDEDDVMVFEASYVAPDLIAPAVKKSGWRTDALYYRTSRGSEPNLTLGCRYLMTLLQKYTDGELFSGSCSYQIKRDPLRLDITVEEIARLVGQPIELSRVVQILSGLGFGIERTEEGRVVFEVPSYRHDILNRQDVIEEIVRMVGIDNIAVKPLCFEEENRLTYDQRRYRFIRDLRMRAVAEGFFETVHYIFCDNSRLKALGFEPVESDKALVNPITSEMDGLRPSLMVTMLDSLKRNVAFSKRRIPLFEVGRVFSKEREEQFNLLLVHSGEKEAETVSNSGKPALVDFPFFVNKLSAVIGPFELRNIEAPNALAHPYQCAVVIVEGKEVGVVAKLHPEVAKAYDLPDTYFAEIEIPKLTSPLVYAQRMSALTPVQRDLSVLVPKTLSYSEIKQALSKSLPKEVDRFYPIDRYWDEKLGDRVSLTLRFVLTSMDETLEEAQINAVMEEVLAVLQQACGAVLR